MKKSVILFLLFPLLLLMLCAGCRNPFYMGKEPKDGTSWASKDGKIMFTRHDIGTSYGTMDIGSETIPIDFSIYDGLINVDDIRSDPPETIEWMSYEPGTEDEFVVEVNKTTYLEEDQKIKFHRLDYDPFASVTKYDLITCEYSIEEIEAFRNEAEYRFIYFPFIKECVRKTHQGLYVVLRLEDGRFAYFFFDGEKLLTDILITDAFVSKDDFSEQTLAGMHESEVLELDPNTILLPVSSFDMTAHILQEGVCIVTYDRMQDRELLEDPIVSSVRFYDNESIPTSNNPLVKYTIPYIEGVDKTDE